MCYEEGFYYVKSKEQEIKRAENQAILEHLVKQKVHNTKKSK